MTNTYVERLHTGAGGKTVTDVEVIQGPARRTFSADIVVVACGALSSSVAAAALGQR